MEEDETNRKSEKKKGLKIILDTCDTRAHKHASTHTSAPGEEDAFHNVEILHQHISLRLGAEVANSITNTQLDGPLQSRGGGLEAVNREKNNRVKCGWEVVGENRDDKQTYKRQRQIEREMKRKSLPSCMLSLQRRRPSCGQSFSHGQGPFLMGTASVRSTEKGIANVYMT